MRGKPSGAPSLPAHAVGMFAARRQIELDLQRNGNRCWLPPEDAHQGGEYFVNRFHIFRGSWVLLKKGRLRRSYVTCSGPSGSPWRSPCCAPFHGQTEGGGQILSYPRFISLIGWFTQEYLLAAWHSRPPRIHAHHHPAANLARQREVHYPFRRHLRAAFPAHPPPDAATPPADQGRQVPQLPQAG